MKRPFIAIVAGAAALAVLCSYSLPAQAQHGGGHGGGGHGGGGHGGGVGVHIGGGGVHVSSGGHSGGYSVGHGYVDSHHPSWSYVLPYVSSRYTGTYYWDQGTNYYVPQTYGTAPGTYVAAKPIELKFGGFAYVDDLSGRLEWLANQLCLDLHYNYQDNPGFADVYREAYRVLETAKYIHSKDHQGDRAEVARRLADSHGPWHHVQEEVQNWGRRANRQVGEGDALTKIQLLESTLHHLMYDVGVKEAADAAGKATPAPSEDAPAPAPAPAQ